MTSKKFLSEKKALRMTFTTSPALKDWIERYVRKKSTKNPLDKRYKSISSFCHETLDGVMKIYEKGKNLDDFERLINRDVKDFFDQLSTNVHLPFLEAYAKPSIYVDIDFKNLMRVLILSKQFYTKDMDPYDIKSLNDAFDRIKDRYYEMGITKSLEFEISTLKDSKHLRCVVEHVGIAKGGCPVNNTHIANCKIMLQMMGFLGFKVLNLETSFHELYYQIEMVTTDLYFQKKLSKKERLILVDKNVKFLTNYNRLIDDDDYQLWMKLANSQSCVVEFKSDKAFEEWISIVESDIEDFERDFKHKTKILKFFERIHWIQLAENHTSFTFQLSIGLSNNTTRRLFKYLDKNFHYDKEGDTFFIPKN